MIDILVGAGVALACGVVGVAADTLRKMDWRL